MVAAATKSSGVDARGAVSDSRCVGGASARANAMGPSSRRYRNTRRRLAIADAVSGRPRSTALLNPPLGAELLLLPPQMPTAPPPA